MAKTTKTIELSFVEKFLMTVIGLGTTKQRKMTATHARHASLGFAFLMSGSMPILGFISAHVWVEQIMWLAIVITVITLGYSLPKVAKLTTGALGKTGGWFMAVSLEVGMILSCCFEGWHSIVIGYLCLALLVVANTVSASTELYFNCKTLVTTKGVAKKGR